MRRVMVGRVDADWWGGVAFFVGGLAIGVFLLWAMATAPRRLAAKGETLTRSRIAIGLGSAVAFIGFGVLMLFTLTLAARHNRTLTITEKFELAGSGRAPTHYQVVTAGGTYEAGTPGVYNGLVVGHRYACSIRDTGYRGSYTPFEDQSTLESCHPSG